MISGVVRVSMVGTLLVSGLALMAPAADASSGQFLAKRQKLAAPRTAIGTYTPAAADPRLAAAFARSGIASTGFRFTPAASDSNRRSVRVAVRARVVGKAGGSGVAPGASSLLSVSPTLGLNPVAYNLGVGVGWKRFAVSGDVARVDSAAMPGGRETVGLGISYNASKWSTRVQLGAEKPRSNLPPSLSGGETISLDVGGSYRLTRRLDVTAGVRYKTERDRLAAPADNIRDSQAVYVGTAFRF